MQFSERFRRMGVLCSFLRTPGSMGRFLRITITAALPLLAPMSGSAGEATEMKAAVQFDPGASIVINRSGTKDRPRTYTGFVKWGRAAQEQSGLSAWIAVTADVYLPDAGLGAALVFEKNNDAALPASHVISIKFSPVPGHLIGEVTQIGAPSIRKENAERGKTLEGLAVAITNNNFIFGLARGDPEQQNMDLLKSGDWIDVPLHLNNDLIATLTIKKGSTGEKLVADAIESWTQDSGAPVSRRPSAH